ncbi:MAG TPA: hypothetical protein VFQ61_08100 [Polyangiaceae bacterium]|nr:hypothetical protein [Polyangiaceae bacterium]
MSGTLGMLSAVLLGVGCLTLCRIGHAGDLFEIQVYEAEVNNPLQAGLEAHLNYTFSGRRSAEYAGEAVPHHAARLTLEPALGLTEYLEVGAYLQNMIDRDGTYRFAGWKLRTKWVVPRRYTGRFFLGINAEIGKVPRAVEEHGWANEFRPILGYDDGHWLFDVNPIFGYALSGPDKLRPDFEPAGKVAFNTQLGFSIGTEYYAGLGYLSALPAPRSEQDHLLFLTFDLAQPASAKSLRAPRTEAQSTSGENPTPESDEAELPFELNVGLGRGLSDATPQRWIVKAIFGRAF